MSVVTKTGDGGSTSLIGGQRVSKDDARLQAYGNVDELSSVIGLLITYCQDEVERTCLTQVQRALFYIGGYLATDQSTTTLMEGCILPEEFLEELEKQIKSLEEGLPPFRCFILPGGTRASAVAHVCRTVCRRTERAIVTLHNEQPEDRDIGVMRYVNRLSDYLFVLARKLNADAGVEDTAF